MKEKIMMTKFLPLLLCSFLSGCYVQSLNKFYTDDLKVELPQIAGEWISRIQAGNDVSDKKISPWKFTEDAIESYDEDDKYSELKVAYFKIGDNLFVDFTAGEPSTDDSGGVGNIFWGAGITLTHSLCRITIKDDSLIIVPMNIEWFEGKAEDKTLALSFVKADKDSNLIFTASAEQWVAFLRTHINDNDLFDDDLTFEFKKVKPATKN
jgi:hypothetical protein